MTAAMRKTIAITVSVFALYLVSVMMQAQLWSDILATAGDLLAIGIVFHTVFTTDNRMYRTNYILIGMGMLCWGVADLTWFIYDNLLQKVPGESTLIALLYTGTNVFLCAAVVLYAIFRLRKWDVVQFLLDAVCFSAALLWLLWVVMFDMNGEAVRVLLSDDITSTICIWMDVFVLILIGIWYLSVRKGKIPTFFGLLTGMIYLFSLTDLVYYYQFALRQYIPNSYLDATYLLSLLGMAVATQLYYKQHPHSFQDDQNSNSNIGNRHKGVILLAGPVLIFLFRGAYIALQDIAFYVGLAVLHVFASNYILKSVTNRELLGREVEMNQTLEKQVFDRTHDLELKNEELLRKNEELKYINNHDALTGLYNRKYFLEKLNEQIMDVSGEEEVLLILWNVDNLNGLNNTYGHDIGDQILVLLADRVKTAMGSVGVLSRLGGDEFAFAMKGMFHNHEFMAVAQRILDVCEMPLIIGDYTFHITVGMGVARYPLCSADPVILMKHADVAMRFTKDTGRETHISLYIDIDTTVKRKYRIGSYLKNCNLDDELELYFQPQFRMADRKLIGMEALLRWNSPEMGLVGPDEFIPVAEDENLIIPIGNWVIDNAVRQIAAWNHAYGKDLRMGINISPKQLDQVSLLSHLAETVLRCDAQFSWLDIEITESITLDNEDSAAKLNQYFKGEGMAISIDDFGTGYSSLGYLNILSFDRLKIAKPLIDKITVDESNRKIVGSIILLAQSLGLQTIAEGVETKEQFDLLLSLGCDQIQGFYLGKPVPAKLFADTFLEAFGKQTL